MRIWMGFALSLAMSGVAIAQPAPPPPEPPGPPAPGDPAPAPAPASVAPPMAPMTMEPADPGRPTELAFAIGVGYVFPTTLQTPNITSVRVRLPSGLTFEPQLVAATTSEDVDNGVTTTTNKQNQLTVASLVHVPVKAHRKVDFELIGAAALSSRTIDPEGDNNNRTITSIGLDYGLAVAYWLTPHWNLSFTGTSPLFQYVRTRQENGAAPTSVDKSTTIGLVFDPQIALMIHLYN